MTPEPGRVRVADPDRDAAACAALYAPYVERTAISFEEVAPTAHAMAARMRHLLPSHPWLVLEREGELAGFAYAAPYSARPAYRWAAEVSVYVRTDRHRRGVGRMLYGELLARLRAQGFHRAYAGIALPNPASVALHEALGFRPVGVSPALGWKAGRWHDLGRWQLDLVPPGTPPAGEPLPPAP